MTRPLAEMAVKFRRYDRPSACGHEDKWHECTAVHCHEMITHALFVPLEAAEEAVREAREAGAIEALTAVYGERENDQAQIVRAHVLSSIRSEAKP
jgi:hypothetical protein